MSDEGLTLAELLAKANEAAPLLDEKVADILRRNPDLAALPACAQGTQGISKHQLGRVVAIALVDFICSAFDRPQLGYVPPDARDR